MCTNQQPFSGEDKLRWQAWLLADGASARFLGVSLPFLLLGAASGVAGPSYLASVGLFQERFDSELFFAAQAAVVVAAHFAALALEEELFGPPDDPRRLRSAAPLGALRRRILIASGLAGAALLRTPACTSRGAALALGALISAAGTWLFGASAQLAAAQDGALFVNAGFGFGSLVAALLASACHLGRAAEGFGEVSGIEGLFGAVGAPRNAGDGGAWAFFAAAAGLCTIGSWLALWTAGACCYCRCCCCLRGGIVGALSNGLCCCCPGARGGRRPGASDRGGAGVGGGAERAGAGAGADGGDEADDEGLAAPEEEEIESSEPSESRRRLAGDYYHHRTGAHSLLERAGAAGRRLQGGAGSAPGSEAGATEAEAPWEGDEDEQRWFGRGTWTCLLCAGGIFACHAVGSLLLPPLTLPGPESAVLLFQMKCLGDCLGRLAAIVHSSDCAAAGKVGAVVRFSSLTSASLLRPIAALLVLAWLLGEGGRTKAPVAPAWLVLLLVVFLFAVGGHAGPMLDLDAQLSVPARHRRAVAVWNRLATAAGHAVGLAAGYAVAAAA